MQQTKFFIQAYMQVTQLGIGRPVVQTMGLEGFFFFFGTFLFRVICPKILVLKFV